MTETEIHFIRTAFKQGEDPQAIGFMLYLARMFKVDPHVLRQEIEDLTKDAKKEIYGLRAGGLD